MKKKANMKKKAKSTKRASRATKFADYEIQFFDGSWWKMPYYAHLICPGNSEIIAPSQGYSSKQARAKTWDKLAKKLGCKIVELSPVE